jgi:antitoxin HicB
MKYHFKIYKEKKGYWAECLEIEGCLTQADSRLELNENMKEALNLYLSEPEDSSIIFNMPLKKNTAKNVVEVKVEPKVAMAMMIRQIRIKRKFTQKKMAEILGFKNIFSYQRLENPKTSNPEMLTLVKIKAAFPELSLELIIAA